MACVAFCLTTNARFGGQPTATRGSEMGLSDAILIIAAIWIGVGALAWRIVSVGKSYDLWFDVE
jgi:hypothetical protein